MTIEKVYDELYGMIEDLKKQIAAGGGGDDVTITPALESGTKIADFSIGSDEGVLYAPTPEAYSFDIGTTPQKIGKYETDDLYIVKAVLSENVSVATNDWSTFCELADADDVVGIFPHILETEYNERTIIEPRLRFKVYSPSGVTSLAAIAHGSALTMNSGSSFIIWYTKTPPTEAKKTTKKK